MTDEPYDLGGGLPRPRMFAAKLTDEQRWQEHGLIDADVAFTLGVDPAVDAEPFAVGGLVPGVSSMRVEQTLDAEGFRRLHRLLAGGGRVDVGGTHQMVLSWPHMLPHHRGPGKLSRWPGSRASWAARRRMVTALNRRRRRRGQPTHYRNPQAIMFPRVQFVRDEITSLLDVEREGEQRRAAWVKEMFLQARVAAPPLPPIIGNIS